MNKNQDLSSKRLKVLELFAGTRSIGKAFEERGHEVFSVEWNKDFENIDLYKDIGELTAQEIIKKFGHPDVIWLSPDCTSYSIAGISHHRKKNLETGSLDAVSDYAKFCDKVNKHCLDLVRELKPEYWFIENPRGSRTGTQGIKGSILRSVIPHDLCYHIATICEEDYENIDLCL